MISWRPTGLSIDGEAEQRHYNQNSLVTSYYTWYGLKLFMAGQKSTVKTPFLTSSSNKPT